MFLLLLKNTREFIFFINLVPLGKMGGDDLDFLISIHIYPDYIVLDRDVNTQLWRISSPFLICSHDRTFVIQSSAFIPSWHFNELFSIMVPF